MASAKGRAARAGQLLNHIHFTLCSVYRRYIMDKAANRKVHHHRCGVLSTPIHSSTDRQHLPSREIMQVIGCAGAAGDDITQPARKSIVEETQILKITYDLETFYRHL